MARQKRKKTEEKHGSQYRWCKHCSTTQNARGFHEHLGFCARNVAWSQTRHSLSTEISPSLLKDDGTVSDSMETDLPNTPTSQSQCPSPTLEADNTSMILDFTPESDGPPSYGPNLPEAYLKVVPHPHSLLPTRIIPLSANREILPPATVTDSGPKLRAQPEFKISLTPTSMLPYAPFRTLADFEYTETAVQGVLSRKIVDRQLQGIASSWCKGSNITLQSYSEMKRTLCLARAYGIQFRSATVSAEYQGEIHTFNFEYRDPWECIKELVADPTLAQHNQFHATRIYYGEREKPDRLERVIGDLNTGDTWWENETELPPAKSLNDETHVFLGMHLWIDKGLVTRRIKKYPMLMRPGWLPSEIRNGSGNGGGILLLYMPIIEDSEDTARNSVERLNFNQFKREIYQKVLKIVFSSLRSASWHGYPLPCGDGNEYIGYPGVYVESLDLEEAWCFCASRSLPANHPCPKCLVHRDELADIMGTFRPRTAALMSRILKAAQAKSSATQREIVLRNHGLHNVKHFLWDFRFSDPYHAYSYDTLHSDDLGKWGHHLWGLLLQVLEDTRRGGELNKNMANFPRWRDLKHYDNVTSISFTDGQSYYDILKCILPCIVQLLPRDCSLVHCIRALLKYRMLIGMTAITESRIAVVKDVIRSYQFHCDNVSTEYDKSFGFPKQHAMNHVITDIMSKGAAVHFSTRPGEGFMQEAEQAYRQTNCKNAEHQAGHRPLMSHIDEEQEAIARIRMAIDLAKESSLEEDSESLQNSEESEQQPSRSLQIKSTSQHWVLGAHDGKGMGSKALEAEFSNIPIFRDFDMRLRTFLSVNLPELMITYEDVIKIDLFKCLHIRFQSKEDWTEKEDILRCNTSFHSQLRHDCVLVNLDERGLHCARLLAIFQCRLSSNRYVDIAIVRFFKRGKWRPNTTWDDCLILEEPPESEHRFLLLKYIIRGALLAPVQMPHGSKGAGRAFFLVDSVDGDMLLRSINRSRDVCI